MKNSFLIFFLFLCTEIVAAQCAMCKAVVENGDAEVAQGLNDGILYLMVFPYILVGVLFYFIYRYKAQKKN
jgi:heme/copper-type cytochrome/quinol oxidase subunit 2